MTLGKVRITAFVSISAGLGYILAAGGTEFEMILPIIGIFILSSGSAALNQYQEYKYDKLMERTNKRPIPLDVISPKYGLLISFSAIIMGEAILLLSANTEAFLLGLLAVIWYNAIYTPLKRVSSLAVVPGALIGAIPPAIGWVAAGGDIMNPQVWALGLFFFIWQIPHFWLLLMIYDKDYEKAGFPTLTQIFSHVQLTRITYVWIIALVASCMLIPLFGLSQNILTDIFLFAAGFWLIWRTKNLLKQYQNKKTIRFAFMNVNFYVLAVAFLLSIDKMINL